MIYVYTLQRKDPEYDEVQYVVVLAESGPEARQLAAESVQGDGSLWLDPHRSVLSRQPVRRRVIWKDVMYG